MLAIAGMTRFKRICSLLSFQCTPVMEFNKFVTLWIFCLCLVGESWSEKPSSSTADSQVVENGVSGESLNVAFQLLQHLYVLFLSTCWAQQTHTEERQWVYNCTCHIFVIVQALYVAMLRIVQLAFSIKPCPPTEIGPTSQTSLYNH